MVHSREMGSSSLLLLILLWTESSHGWSARRQRPGAGTMVQPPVVLGSARSTPPRSARYASRDASGDARDTTRRIVPNDILDATYDDIAYQNQILRLETVLKRLTDLELSLEWTSNQTVLQDVYLPQLDILEDTIVRETALPLPPRGCSIADYRAGISAVRRIPAGYRRLMCQVLMDRNIEGIDQSLATDFTRIPQLVAALYTYQRVFTSETIRQAKAHPSFNAVANTKVSPNGPKVEIGRLKQLETSRSLFAPSNGASDDSDEARTANFVESLLPRVTRYASRTLDDAPPMAALWEAAVNPATNRLAFARDAAEPEGIPGGLVVRGTNQCASPAALVTALDHAMANNAASYPNVTVCYVPDITSRLASASFDPVLLVLHRDMSPTSKLFPTLSTLAAMCTAVLFAIGVYTDGGSITAFDKVLNADLSVAVVAQSLDVLIPMCVIAAAHEVSHWAVARRDGFQIAFGRIGLPSWPLLPWLATQTRLSSSPPNVSSLFDFAAVGPLVGLVTAATFLGLGLAETATASAEALSSFPSLPVSLLKLSTLGATAVDSIVSGGTLLYQAPETAIALHPWAIAGFTGLVIQALELLPLGATDGGRISLAVFGRLGHSFVGATVWTILLGLSFFDNTELLVAAWIAYNFCQNDMEIPCRDEVTKLDFGRGSVALVLWIVTLLIITPL